jgi:hypothetical protein
MAFGVLTLAKTPAQRPKTQRERFIEAARESGATEDEKAFEQRLKAVARGNSSTGAKKPVKTGKK